MYCRVLLGEWLVGENLVGRVPEPFSDNVSCDDEGMRTLPFPLVVGAPPALLFLGAPGGMKFNCCVRCGLYMVSFDCPGTLASLNAWFGR